MKKSLRAKLILAFLAVIIVCGLVATIVGVRLIGTGIIDQAQAKVKNDLNSVWEIYREETEMYTHLALENLKEENPARGNLEKAVKEASRCRDIVQGLLDFSRQTEPKVEETDVRL